MYLLGALGILIALNVQCNADIPVSYFWNVVQFENLPLKEDSYIGPFPYFIPTNNEIAGSGYHAQSGLMIVTIARLLEGVPSALNAFCIQDYSLGTSPHLWGFPNFKTNTLRASDYNNRARRSVPKSDPSEELRNKKPYYEPYSQIDYRIMSIYRPTIDDRCNRLFVVDTGIISTIEDVRYWAQRPALVVYDLPSNGCSSRNFATLWRVELPETVWKNPLGFDFATLDYQSKGGCDDLMIYINNVFDNSIVVYDYVKNDFWMLANHSSFVPVVSESFILGHFQQNYGIMNIELGWPDKKGNKLAYYTPGASTAVYATTTKTLKNRRKAPYSYGSEFRIIGYHGCKGLNHRQFFDHNCGVMFFANTASGQVTCWNVGRPFNPNNIGVILQPDPFELCLEVYVDSDGYLWMHSRRVDLDTFYTNLRKVRVMDAIQGTVCDTYEELPDEIAWEYFEEL